MHGSLNNFFLLQDILNLKLLEGQNSNNSNEINQRNLPDKFKGNKFVAKVELIIFSKCQIFVIIKPTLIID